MYYNGVISTSDRKNVVFILNVRLNHEYRVNRLLTLLTKLVDYPNAYISIRVRGIFSFSASNEIRGLFHLKKFLNYKYLSNFNSRVVSSKLNLIKILSNIKNKEKKSVIVGVSAPSRSATLINYVGLNEGIIKCILEIKGSYKIDCYMPGTKIPVVKESEEILKKTNYLILFSWHIAKELIKKLRNRGFKGKFIIPLPKPKIVN